MSVLIKGMEMPESCEKCKLDLRTDACRAFDEWHEKHPYSIRATDRLPDCSLVELPEKHGRLIDGDELFKQMNTAIAMLSGMMKAIGAEDDKEMQMELKAYRDIRDGIKDYETVIEAEGEG